MPGIGFTELDANWPFSQDPSFREPPEELLKRAMAKLNKVKGDLTLHDCHTMRAKITKYACAKMIIAGRAECLSCEDPVVFRGEADKQNGQQE